MNSRERKRLEKLILFLKNLKPQQFNFGEVVTRLGDNQCGSVCCAIGWTPAIFPRSVRWVKCRNPYLTTDKEANVFAARNVEYADVASQLFGIDRRMAHYLFTPSFQKYAHYRLPYCSGISHPKKVAAMLQKFLKLWDEGLIKDKPYER